MFERKLYLSGLEEEQCWRQKCQKKKTQEEGEHPIHEIPRVTFFLRNMSRLFRSSLHAQNTKRWKKKHA